MTTLAKLLTALIAIEHLAILWIEMFGWETVGKKVFKSLREELFRPTKKLAANQGLYNGFLAAGLIWSFLISDPVWQANIALFFLGCVMAAGIFGGITTSRKIFFIQAIPATIPFIIIWLTR